MARGHVTSARSLVTTGLRFKMEAHHVTTAAHSQRAKMAERHVTPPTLPSVTGGNPVKMAAPTRSRRPYGRESPLQHHKRI